MPEFTMSNATPTFFSGLLANSTSSNSTNFSSGVIHVIGHFPTLPSNITDTAVQLNLRSTVNALQVAGLADAVDGLQNVTCLIPDNSAFQAIGPVLATDSPMELSRILKYHVVCGSVLYSPDIMNGSNLSSMNGLYLTITTEMENGTEVIFVNSARVLTANVLVANGVVHVIDNVLNPGNRTAVTNPTATSEEPAFSGASSVLEEPFTRGVASATTMVATSGSQSVASSAAASGSSSGSGLAMPMATGDRRCSAFWRSRGAIEYVVSQSRIGQSARRRFEQRHFETALQLRCSAMSEHVSRFFMIMYKITRCNETNDPVLMDSIATCLAFRSTYLPVGNTETHPPRRKRFVIGVISSLRLP